MQSSPSVLTLSPSFNTHSSARLTEIAARVVQELGRQSADPYGDDDEFLYSVDKETSISKPDDHKPQGNEEDDEFEFSFVCKEPDTSLIPADEIFYNGKIKPLYPNFHAQVTTLRRMPLRQLMTEERDSLSCSSSEADDLEALPPGTYCLWKPKTASSPSSEKCKKSNSTGSSKRWKLRHLLHRSNSDGKDTFVFLTPGASSKKKKEKDGGESAPPLPPTEAEKTPRKHRQDFVGLFSNVNGLSRSLHPF